MLTRDCEAHDLQREWRKRNADERLRNPDAARGHQPIVAGEADDRAAGNGMPVHGRDCRLRKEEHRAKHCIERFDEILNVLASAAHEPMQIDARGKYRARAGDDDRAHVARLRRRLELMLQRETELEVERARFSVRQAQRQNAVVGFPFDHVVRRSPLIVVRSPFSVVQKRRTDNEERGTRNGERRTNNDSTSTSRS